MSSKKWEPASLEAMTSVTRLDDRTFSADLSPTYCIGTVPNGGYVASIFLQVAKAYLSPRGQPDTVVAHWQFLARTQKGRALLRVEDARPGRAQSVLHITLHQHGLLPASPWLADDAAGRHGEVAAYITNRSIDSESGISLATGWSLPSPPPPVADLAALPRDADPHWGRMHIWLMDRLPVMHNLEFYVPRAGHAGPATHDYWIRLAAAGERFTDTALGYVADAAELCIPEAFRADDDEAPPPPGRFDRRALFWYPTVSMDLDVKKKLPASGVEWLRLRAASKLIRRARYDMEVLVFDEQGDLVAIAHLVAMIMGLERNYADRGEVPTARTKI